MNMCHNTVWRCTAAFCLLLLQLAADTRLTPQGTGHDVIHDTLIEGITFQEWGESAGVGSGVGGAGVANGAALPSEALRLSPPELSFGRCALGAAHSRTVLLTNTGNATLHLASVSGTTPDFHASFFDAKSLPARANTSFSVAFLPRREGALPAHLYIHTSLGVHKYAVRGEGAPGEYRVAPLALRVPRDATLTAPLLLHNPNATPLQVLEVYSSAAWLGLELPEPAGADAPSSMWTLPPYTTRPLVQLRVRAHRLPPPAAPHHHSRPHTAYIRIKVNDTAPPLVICVEVTQEAAGVYAQPPRVEAGVRGTRDPPAAFDILLGNSASASARVQVSVTAPLCDGRAAPPLAAELVLHPMAMELPAHAEPRDGATLMLHWERMAAAAEAEARSGAEGVWCGGEVSVRSGAGRRLVVPYRARLLPGTLRLDPPLLSLVTARQEDALRERLVRVRNEFAHTLYVGNVQADAALDKHIIISEWHGAALAAGTETTLARVRLRHYDPALVVAGEITITTNVSEYRLPVHISSGRLHFEWDWPVPGAGGTDTGGALDLGAVTTSATRRVSGRLRNPGPAPLCVTALGADMDGAALQYLPCAVAATPPDTEPSADDPCWCINGGDSAPISLALVAAAREGAATGRVWVRTAHARTEAPLTMRAVKGKLRATLALLDHCAPNAWCSSPLQLENSMEAQMRLVTVEPHPPDVSLRFVPAAEAARELPTGVSTLGDVVFIPELLEAVPRYTGFALDTPEGSAWEARCSEARGGAEAVREALFADAALLRERRALHATLPVNRHNFTLLLHTTEVVMVSVGGSATLRWPRLAARSADAGLAAVGAASRFSVTVRNPSTSHPLVVHAVLGPPLEGEDVVEWSEQWDECVSRGCSWDEEAFRARSWAGDVGPWAGAPGAGGAEAGAVTPPLVVAPGGQLAIELEFVPQRAARLAALLYLRNNLTVAERVVLTGEGAFPSFKFGNRRAGTGAPLLFELSARQLRECARAGAGAVSARRAFTARNTGAIPVQVAALTVSGLPCEGYGFRVHNCAPFTLDPNGTYKVEVSFTPDFTLSRVTRALVLHTSLGAPLHYTLVGAVPAHRLPACGAALARPVWEPYLRNAVVSLMICLGLSVLITGFLDADRVLRHAAAHAPPAAPPPPLRRPLDLRTFNHHHHHWSDCGPPRPAPPSSPPAASVSSPPQTRDPTPPPIAVSRPLSPPTPTPAVVPPPEPTPPPVASEDHVHHRTKRRTPRRTQPEPEPDRLAPAEPREPSPSPSPPPMAPRPHPSPPSTLDDDDTSSTGTDVSGADDRDKEPADDDGCGSAFERPRADGFTAQPAPPVPVRARRDLATPTRRHEERARPDARHSNDAPPVTRTPHTAPAPAALPLNKYQQKKDKPAKKRPERVHIATSRGDSSFVNDTHTRSSPPAPAAPPVSRPAWGATFSEVVAASGGSGGGGGAGALAPPPAPNVPHPPRRMERPAVDAAYNSNVRPLGPIGSNYQKRAGEREEQSGGAVAPSLADNNSLFFFGGEAGVGVIGKPAPAALDAADFSVWQAPAAAHKPLYTGSLGSGVWGRARADEPSGGAGAGAGRGAAAGTTEAAWTSSWSGYGVRPPPGFATHPHPHHQIQMSPVQTVPVRPFDPFQSLSSIWAPPGALHHLRRDHPPEQ